MGRRGWEAVWGGGGSWERGSRLEKTKGEEVAKGVLGRPHPHLPPTPIGPEVAGAQGKAAGGLPGGEVSGRIGGRSALSAEWGVQPGPDRRGWADHNNNGKNYNNNSFSVPGSPFYSPDSAHMVFSFKPHRNQRRKLLGRLMDR